MIDARAELLNKEMGKGRPAARKITNQRGPPSYRLRITGHSDQEWCKRRTAVDLAKDILNLGKNNLSVLGKLSVKELMKVRGIGEAKAITISAALEIGRRREAFIDLGQLTVKSSKDIATYIQSLLRDLQNEVFGVVFLNQANRIKHYEVISMGGITGTVADPGSFLKKLCLKMQ